MTTTPQMSWNDVLEFADYWYLESTGDFTAQINGECFTFPHSLLEERHPVLPYLLRALFAHMNLITSGRREVGGPLVEFTYNLLVAGSVQLEDVAGSKYLAVDISKLEPSVCDNRTVGLTCVTVQVAYADIDGMQY